MADEQAVGYSVGFLEGYINTCEKAGIANSEAARTHLKIIYDAYTEYRRNIGLYQRFLIKLKETINSIA